MKSLKMKLSMVLICISSSVFGQQDPQFTQYFDNTVFINPAYAGSRGMLNATAIHREQWVGIKGRPRSTTFNMHTPLNYDNIGVGFTAVNDAIGPMNQTLFCIDFAYSLKFKNGPGKLAFGLKGGINLLNSREHQLSTTTPNDPTFEQGVTNQINPNFGAGIYYHTPTFFVGVSTPKIIEQSYGNSLSARERRHYFLITGGVFNLTENQSWKLRPTTQLKYTVGAPLSIDLSAAVIYNQMFWLGVTHRWADSFGAFVQYQVTPQFKAGIAYDHTITNLASFNHGTYELLLSYDFTFKSKGLKSPRYF